MIMEERSEISCDQKMEAIMMPGFRFHPTDEELVGFYLKRKVQEKPFTIELIKPLDIYKHDPWDLPKLATTGEKEWYFYCRRDRKYRNSARPNRVTCGGFWKATGSDRPIYSSDGSRCIGLKKSLVFYKGKAAKGFKTDWMMHEFRLPSATDHNGSTKRFLEKTIPPNELWAICRIFKKTSSSAQRALSHSFESPLLPKTQTHLSQYGNDFYNYDLKPFNIDLIPPTLPTNNKTPPTFISCNQETNNLFSVLEPSYNSTIDMPPFISEDFGTESLEYITKGEQQYFNDSYFSFDSIPANTQEQDQECITDKIFKSLADVVYFENLWDFSNSNNII